MVFVHAVHRARAEVSYILCGSRACNSQHGAFFLIVLLPGRSSRILSVAFVHATYRTKLPFLPGIYACYFTGRCSGSLSKDAKDEQTL